MAALRPTAIRAMGAQRGAFRPSRAALAPASKPVFQPHVGRFAVENVYKWLPTFAVWGVGLGGAVTLFMSQVPLFQNDVLKKIPIVAGYFEDTTPDEDKPF
ncbi:hypothetical protein FA10DRAFT_298633 [Acaromyces ingoldii]|uniref:Uncharacterized protein n=1 Tax=Acaromyces ingoldii TaxID=215250 RepID=A0A316YYT3_9BASI|nr:hypothetical protein FA10DRAFT_298633 [Acaromyces ingoldii]PWN93223.1 hypothetical protein FA10DRAFT_298633 [Acaromyces ingoldii]